MFCANPIKHALVYLIYRSCNPKLQGLVAVRHRKHISSFTKPQGNYVIWPWRP